MSKEKSLLFIIIVTAIVAGAYLFRENRNQPVETLTPSTQETDSAQVSYEAGLPYHEVVLASQNNSNERGIAHLDEQEQGEGKLLVTLVLDGAPTGVSQPAHIHVGSCENLGGVAYPLTFPLDGSSTTTLATTLADLYAQLPLAINVHKSTDEPGTYVACGDLL